MKPRVVARIDLAALRHNYNVVQERVCGARIFAVVKANAYGHGLIPIASSLRDVADGFAVASLEEAQELRSAGIDNRILVLGGPDEPDDLLVSGIANVDLVVHNPVQVDWAATSQAQVPRIWIKLDSGMHRLGFSYAEFCHVYDRLVSKIGSDRLGIISHLPCADGTDKTVTAKQIAAFELQTASTGVPRSLANSAATLAFTESHFDWVRPGLALFGISPFDGQRGADLRLQPVMTLETRLVAIKPVPAGGYVGYGATWRASRDSIIGVAAAGYGDGYPWRAGNAAVARVGPHTVPVVGRVSMDMLALDLTGLDSARIGDSVRLWGNGLPVEGVAAAAGTLPYELICGVTRRVRFEYKQVAQQVSQTPTLRV